MEVAFACTVCVPGVGNRYDDCEEVGWCSQQEGDDFVVAESGDYGWEEVGDGTRGSDHDEHDHLHGRH